MADERPNILLLMTDQQRGDCLGIEGHPVLQTPYLDAIGRAGVRFRHAYTACPMCIPARRTLMAGQRPRTHGVVCNYDTHLDGPTLPGELAKAGYQTHLCGKLHLYPVRKRYGFESEDWADGPGFGGGFGGANDYTRFLVRHGLTMPLPSWTHGMDGNGWLSRPWSLDERFHITNWTADRALEFLERRDPTRPFFLKVSFFFPHQPCTPPQFYYDHYMGLDLPEPYVGDWARVFDGPQRGLAVDSHRVCLDPVVMKQYRAGYYGAINHIDNQIGRLKRFLPVNTIVVFCSDHGEMLGDHQYSRKSAPYEPSARIPMLMRFPESMGLAGGVTVDEPVELMDIMPTLLDAVGVPVPCMVDGRSVLGLLRGDDDWRPYLHGEAAHIGAFDSGMQFLTDGKRKYIWFPGVNREQFFDIENDPTEMHDLIHDPGRRDEIETWRRRLVEELTGRPEGFTDGRRLLGQSGATALCLPGYERQ